MEPWRQSLAAFHLMKSSSPVFSTAFHKVMKSSCLTVESTNQEAQPGPWLTSVIPKLLASGKCTPQKETEGNANSNQTLCFIWFRELGSWKRQFTRQHIMYYHSQCTRVWTKIVWQGATSINSLIPPQKNPPHLRLDEQKYWSQDKGYIWFPGASGQSSP